MASKERKITLKWSKKDINYIRRFIVDVLVHVRREFWIPGTELPYTNCDEIKYYRDDFLQRATLTTLKVSLFFRDMWRGMFQSRIRESELNEQNVCKFLAKLLKCCPLIRGGRLENCVAVSLALSSEIMLFVIHEGLRVPFSEIVISNAAFILTKLQLDEEDLEVIEELFDTYDDVAEYNRFITDFIMRFAIPYESSKGVSDLFSRKDFRTTDWEDELTEELHNLFSPNTPNQFSSSPPEEYEDFPENLEESNLQDAVKSPIYSSESGAVGEEESDSTQPLATVNGKETSLAKSSEAVSLEPKIEDIFVKMNLNSGETSENQKGAIPKRKRNSKKKRKRW